MSAATMNSHGQPIVRGNAEIGLAIAVVFVIALLVVPLPPLLLDLFLALSIALSLVILLVALYTVDPLDFSSFPALLLLLTLFRLALNVASTRLILTEAHAGSVIQAFGQFVVGGNYAVGVILFLILVGINFIVITKGAGRVAEVAARFTLDAMPGKQMSIDADLNAGVIDEAQARKRREEVSRAADFYGAMDGSSKFVKGDAVASLLITAINVIGGIFIGVIQRGMPIADAASTYTILTVGEGLVSQIPALIVSTAAGIMVTNASGGSRMGAALANQLFSQPRAMWIAAGVLVTFGLIPGLPSLPFLMLGGGTAMLARGAERSEKKRSADAEAAELAAEPAPEAESPMRDLLQIDPIELEVGYALISLVDENEGGDLLQRISLLRKQAALELGILVPPVRIRDDIRLPASEYVIKLRGAEIARGEVMPRFLLALDTGGVIQAVDGVQTIDPSFGMPARWISPARRIEAESFGYVVVEPPTVVATHLMEMLKSNAGELLGRQDVQEMTDTLRKTHPALVEDVVPGKISLGVLHRVLQRLLKERVPIRDLVTILEALGDAADQTKDPEALTEHVRRSLAHVIARLHLDDSGGIHAITVGPRLEAALMGLFSPRMGQSASSLLDPDALAGLLRELGKLANAHSNEGRPAPLVTPPALRVGIRRLIEPVLPTIPVLSLAELPPQINLDTIATWEFEMHKRRSGSSTTIDLATFRGRDLQSASEAARAAMGDHAMILRVIASRDGFSPSVEIVAADGGDIDRFRARLESPPLSIPAAGVTPRRPLVIALVGPGGAGKSTTIAKLGTHRQGFASWKVGYLTLDTFRMGALAELRGYAEIAGIPLEVAYDESEVDEALESLSDCDVVLIDTPGRGAVGDERSARWAPLLHAAQPDEVHFLLPATVRADAAATARASMRGLGVTHLLVTKLDEVQEDVGLADLALQLALPARWIADGQEISGSLLPAPGRIVSALAALADSPDLRITA